MKKKNQTFLWKIIHPDCKRPSYLLGTMHVRDQRAFEQLAKVQEKIAACDAYAAEFDLGHADSSVVNEQMKLPEGQLLSDWLSPKSYAVLAKLLKKRIGVDLDVFQKQKPFFVYNMLTESLFQDDMPFALDQYLYQWAAMQEKEMTGVETFMEQMEIMEKISLKKQAKILAQTTKNFKKYRRQLKKMTSLYQEGNLNQLHKSALKNMGSLRKLLVYDRNEIMAKRITDMVAEQSVFIAVGAGHLSGKKGILRLLKQAGCKVKSEQWGA